jgi:hypothetical protein
MEFKVGDRVKFLEGHGLLRKETFGRIGSIGKRTVAVIAEESSCVYQLYSSDIEHADDETKAVPDTVNHPSHYTDGKIEVIDFIEDKKLNYHRGNAVKYIARAGKKDPTKEIEDLKKAQWYINREIKRLEVLEK